MIKLTVDECSKTCDKKDSFNETVLNASMPLLLTKYYEYELKHNLDESKKHIMIFDCNELFETTGTDKNTFDKNNTFDDRLCDLRASYHFMDDMTYPTYNRIFYIDRKKLSLLKFCVQHFNVVLSMDFNLQNQNVDDHDEPAAEEYQLFFYYLNEHILKVQCNGHKIVGFIDSLTCDHDLCKHIFCQPIHAQYGDHQSPWYSLCQQVRLLSDYKYELLMFFCASPGPFIAYKFMSLSQQRYFNNKNHSNVLIPFPFGLSDIQIWRSGRYVSPYCEHDALSIKPIKDILLIYKYFYDYDSFHAIWHKNQQFRMIDYKQRINLKYLQNMVKNVTDNRIRLNINDIIRQDCKTYVYRDSEYKYSLIFDAKFWFATEKDEFVTELKQKFGIDIDTVRSGNDAASTIDTLKFISFDDLVSIFGTQLIKDYILFNYDLKVCNKQYKASQYENGIISAEIDDMNPKYRFESKKRHVKISNIYVANQTDNENDDNDGTIKKQKKKKRHELLSQIKHECDCENNDDGKCIHSFRLYLEYIKQFYAN